MAIVILVSGILLLVVLIALIRLSAYLSLLPAALYVGIANKMQLQDILASIVASIILVIAAGGYHGTSWRTGIEQPGLRLLKDKR